MKADLRTLLLSHEPLTDLVGESGVFVQHARQGAPLPYVVIEQTGADEHNTLDGPSGSFRAMEYEISAKGRTALEAEHISETVRELLKDYTGAAGNQVIDAVVIDDEFDDIERPVNGSDQKTYVVVLQLTLQYHPQ